MHASSSPDIKPFCLQHMRRGCAQSRACWTCSWSGRGTRRRGRARRCAAPGWRSRWITACRWATGSPSRSWPLVSSGSGCAAHRQSVLNAVLMFIGVEANMLICRLAGCTINN